MAPAHIHRPGRPGRPVRKAARRLLALWLLLLVPLAAGHGRERPPGEQPLDLKIRPSGVARVSLHAEQVGADRHVYRYEVVWRDGRRDWLTPEEFADLLYHQHAGTNRLFAFLNITSLAGIAWVSVGFLGQVLFTGRMLVQWLASERSRRSVVPVSFWWMSLVGATMLLAYFVWRRDVVGVLGQATGWLIYVRNLYLIHRGGETSSSSVATAADPDH